MLTLCEALAPLESVTTSPAAENAAAAVAKDNKTTGFLLLGGIQVDRDNLSFVLDVRFGENGIQFGENNESQSTFCTLGT